MKKIIVNFICLLFFTPSFSAQNNNFIVGTVLNNKTLEPIPFATIYWKGDHFGCISNENGTFRLSIEDPEIEKTLIIKCIGYETREISTKELRLNQITLFKLHEKTYTVDEVLIKGKRLPRPTAKDIVVHAINNIVENYPQNPFLLEGYYRDYIKIDSQYLNMYESFIEIEDPGFLESDYEKSKIKQTYGRINHNFTFDTLKVMNYSDQRLKRIPSGEMGFNGGNEFSILRLSDPIRNHTRNNFDFINYLKTDFINNHYFKIIDLKKENDKYVYAIQFKYTKKTSADLEVGARSRVGVYGMAYYPKANADGIIYIENENFTIKKLLYKLYLNDRKFGKLKGWELNLEYKDFNNKAYLNYISFNNVFEIPNYNDSLYFYLKNVHVNIQERRISLEFNNNLNTEIDNNLNLFKIKYKNEKIKFWKVNIDTINNNFVHLYPEITNFNKLFGSFKPELAYLLKVNLPKKFSDINGNKLNKYKSVLGYQYREFFVKNIKLNFTSLNPDECIDKYHSLINYNKIKPDNGKEILFNAPLLSNSKVLND